MAGEDHFEFEIWQGFQADSGVWYRAIELLGFGGNAATFLSYCTTPPRKGTLYAAKVFRRRSKPERRESFLQEGEFLKGCAHDSIMRVADSGTYKENPFLLCEYLPLTLADIMRRNPTLVQKVSFSIQLLCGLTYLSDLVPPAVHRDIKPDNIFVKGGSCVLGDFGLLKRLDGHYEEDREILKESLGPGMPKYYRTPDLVDYYNNVSIITAKSDVFQLGLVLAKLFTGWNPCIEAKDFAEPVKLFPLKSIEGEFGASIAALLNRMLEFDVEKRPTATQIIDGWEGLFREVVNRTVQLEGKAFRR